MKRIRVLWVIMLSIFVLVACNQDQEEVEEEMRIVPVEVAEVHVGNMLDTQTLYGRTAPQQTTPIWTEVAGVVEEVEVKNGDIVAKDDLIATVRTPAGVVRITAPAHGEIAQFTSKEEDVISPEEPVGIIVDTEEMEITIQVTATVRALFAVEDVYDTTIEGTTYNAVAEVITSIPNETGLYDVQLTVENEDASIIAGMVAAVDVKQTRITDALIVPTEAVIEESEGAFVYVVVENEVERVDVEIRDMQTFETAISGDIEEGAQVVVNGQLTVMDGSKVEVVKVVNGS